LKRRLFKTTDEDPRRYVLIPIVKLRNNDAVESSATNDQLIEVYTQPYTFGDDTDNQAIDKGWDRVAVTLRQINQVLYRSGGVAAGMVRKFGLKRPRMAFYQWLKPQAWLEQQRLYSSAPKELSEGNSAELGLALVLLMAASGSPYRQVIATGALSGQTQLIRERDVEVQPVNNLVEKFKLVIQQVEEGKLPRDKNLLFFIPKYYDQKKTKRVEVESLPEVQTLRTLGIQVVPIEWLSEAAEKLKTNTARYLPQDLILKWFIIALLLVSLSWVSWVEWRDRAIEMEFLKPNNSFTFAEPYLVCDIKNQPLEKVHNPIEIKRNKVTHFVPVINSALGWQVKVGQADNFDTLLSQWLGYQGYYVAAILLSESEMEIITSRKKEESGIVRIRSGEDWRRYVTFEDGPDNTTVILILVAQRHKPINSSKLTTSIEQFRQTITTNAVEPDIRAKTDFILSQFPGGLIFRFKTVEEKLECTS
jgi:hypothetical protein